MNLGIISAKYLKKLQLIVYLTAKKHNNIFKRENK